jgi:hypothetical protein
MCSCREARRGRERRRGGREHDVRCRCGLSFHVVIIPVEQNWLIIPRGATLSDAGDSGVGG